MPIGILFWALFIIFIIFNGLWYRNGSGWAYGWSGNAGLIIFLIFLLGWNDFGFILQGGRGSPFH